MRTLLKKAEDEARAQIPKANAKQKEKISREIEIKARRTWGNKAEHVRIPYNGPPPKNARAASKLRREAMLMCPCRLCALALYPPETFEERALLGLKEPSFDEVNQAIEAAALEAGAQ